MSAVLPTAWVRSVFTLLSAQPGGLHASPPYSHLLLLSSALLIRRTERALFEVASMTLHWPMSISLSNKNPLPTPHLAHTHTHTQSIPMNTSAALYLKRAKRWRAESTMDPTGCFVLNPGAGSQPRRRTRGRELRTDQASALQACRSEGSRLQLLLPSGSSSTAMADTCSSEVQRSRAGFRESESL